MKQISIDYPDAQRTRILDALCDPLGWDYEVNKLPSETQVQFIKRYIADLIFGEVFRVETVKAQQIAAENASQDVKDNIQIT